MTHRKLLWTPRLRGGKRASGHHAGRSQWSSLVPLATLSPSSMPNSSLIITCMRVRLESVQSAIYVWGHNCSRVSCAWRGMKVSVVSL